MNSNWLNQVRATMRKEIWAESRSRHGLMTSGLFSLLTVVTMALAGANSRPGPELAAGIICTVLLFSAIISVPRTFIVEEEQGTFELMSLLCPPSATFVGKMLVGLIPTVVSGLLMITIYIGMANLEIRYWPMLYGATFLICTSLSGAVSLCGALVLGAANRWILAGVAGLPLLIPTLYLGVESLQVAIGVGSFGSGVQCMVGLGGITLAWGSLGPLIADYIWPTPQVPPSEPPNRIT